MPGSKKRVGFLITNVPQLKLVLPIINEMLNSHHSKPVLFVSSTYWGGHKINQNYTCNGFDEWSEKILKLAESKNRRIDYIKSASNYVNKHCSAEVIFNTWEYVFFGK